MHFEQDAIYHIFNRSNETLFHERDNYLFFLSKIRKHILPFADIFAYCLMPNHFHLLLSPNAEGVKIFPNKGSGEMQYLSDGIGVTNSSYTQAMNKKLGKRGSLFAHTTRSKLLNGSNNDYDVLCFMYIHQNPKLANLVDKIEDWEFSSFRDYIGIRNGTLVNKRLALDVLNINVNDIYGLTYKLLSDKSDDDFL